MDGEATPKRRGRHGLPASRRRSQRPPGADQRLECLGKGALLIDQIDKVPDDLRPALLELVRSGRWSGTDGVERRSPGRVVLTNETTVPDLDPLVRQIRVPPLPEEVFWTERRSTRARFDLWCWKPVLREWMRSPRLWNALLQPARITWVVLSLATLLLGGAWRWLVAV
jgi:hypothetical protein